MLMDKTCLVFVYRKNSFARDCLALSVQAFYWSVRLKSHFHRVRLFHLMLRMYLRRLAIFIESGPSVWGLRMIHILNPLYIVYLPTKIQIMVASQRSLYSAAFPKESNIVTSRHQWSVRSAVNSQRWWTEHLSGRISYKKKLKFCDSLG